MSAAKLSRQDLEVRHLELAALDEEVQRAEHLILETATRAFLSRFRLESVPIVGNPTITLL